MENIRNKVNELSAAAAAHGLNVEVKFTFNQEATVSPVVETPVAPVVETPVVPTTPVVETPVVPVVETPVVPVVETPVVPVAPVTPVVETPVVPVDTLIQETTQVVEQVNASFEDFEGATVTPAANATEVADAFNLDLLQETTTPVVETPVVPATPVVETPAAPVVETPTTPVVETPAVPTIDPTFDIFGG